LKILEKRSGLETTTVFQTFPSKEDLHGGRPRQGLVNQRPGWLPGVTEVLTRREI
jgi:hypothetical protein